MIISRQSYDYKEVVMAVSGTDFAKESSSFNSIPLSRVYNIGEITGDPGVTVSRLSGVDIESSQVGSESRDEMIVLSNDLNAEIAPLQTNVRFHFNEDNRELYITVTEANTGRVIRNIPSEEAMRLKTRMREMIGIIFDKEI